ncbi:MAG TPA: EAL domain-containing protein [Candidatus Blautia merdavium]|uniref:EAL domain-containing protein n=1 Tax=Candidatus Blautia merdavium TaxID=2838494 RepID=A0A9D2PNF3_9FIRM|nr:EAL domain-containing protein [Candidatus Blautia merdavium]
MEKEYFDLEFLKEKLGLCVFPDSLFPDMFLLDCREEQVYITRGMAAVLGTDSTPSKGRMSIEALKSYFSPSSSSIFQQDVTRIQEGKTNRTDSHLNLVKNGQETNLLLVMAALEKPGYILGVMHINFDLTHTHSSQLEDTVRQLRQAEMINSLILEGSTDYIYHLDIVNNICTFSPKAMEVLPLENNTFSNAMDRLLSFIVPEDRGIFLESFAPFLTGKSLYHRAEYRVMTKQGGIIWIKCQGKGVHDENGNPLMIAGSLIDITEQKKADQKISDMLLYDVMTGLKNRYCFEQEMQEYLKEPDARGSVLCIDIHNFKVFNEIFGHSFANRILVEFAKIIQLYISNNLGVYRLEGDEFLVHLKESTQEEIRQKLVPFQMYLSKERVLDGHVVFIRANIGVSIYPDNGETAEELIKNANTALLMRTKSQQHQTVFFRSESMDKLSKKYYLENILRQDTADNMKNFRLVYQPIIEKKGDKFLWHGAEALLRYSNSKFQDLNQSELIEALEYSDMIIPVGRWIIRQAVKECAYWHKMGFPISVNVNISAQQVSDEGVVAFIQSCCQEEGLDPKWLICELTETSLIRNMEIAGQFCKELMGIGAGVALDDFGTGYSGLSYLKHLPITHLKVDRTYVQDLVREPYNQIILKCLYDLSKMLGLQICMEGIDTEETLKQVLELEEPLMQGFYFDKPLEAETFRKDMVNHSVPV